MPRCCASSSAPSDQAQPGELHEGADEVDAVGGGDLGRDLVGELRLASVVDEEVGAPQWQLWPALGLGAEAAVEHLEQYLAPAVVELCEVGIDDRRCAGTLRSGGENDVGGDDPLRGREVLERPLHDGGDVASEEARLLGIVNDPQRRSAGAELEHPVPDADRDEVLVEPLRKCLRP